MLQVGIIKNIKAERHKGFWRSFPGQRDIEVLRRYSGIYFFAILLSQLIFMLVM